MACDAYRRIRTSNYRAIVGNGLSRNGYESFPVYIRLLFANGNRRYQLIFPFASVIGECKRRLTFFGEAISLAAKSNAAKPFVKWAGGKTQILDYIRMKYPPGFGKTITKYAEPFVGSGAVLFDILGSYKLDQVFISDINQELIVAYRTIRDNVEALVSRLTAIEKDYLSSDKGRRTDIYYYNRDRYNALKSSADETEEIAALFIFLNKTCYNGLYRVNSKGSFNVPQGVYKNPRICDADNLRAVSETLQNVHIICGDYRESDAFIEKNVFAYFDPPYRPLSLSSNFTAYSHNGFCDKEQIALARYIDALNERGAYILASNSDPKNSGESDGFFDDLYARYKISRINASRAINSNSDKRGKINELLIANY